MNKLFTTTPDGDAVPPQAPHILFRNFTGLTAAHGNPVRTPNGSLVLWEVLSCNNGMLGCKSHAFRRFSADGSRCRDLVALPCANSLRVWCAPRCACGVPPL